MKFDCSAFTHTGTRAALNQDRILVNGMLLEGGSVELLDQESCRCFVADGVGGNKAGEFAATFVLQQISEARPSNSGELRACLPVINQRLIETTRDDPGRSGSACTLTGVWIDQHTFQVFHAGDSQLWLCRNEMLIRLNTDQVLSKLEVNSPITSYFGGDDDYLTLDEEGSDLKVMEHDKYVICSDGILKSLSHKKLKSILDQENTVGEQLQEIWDSCLHEGAPDNISLIIIQAIA